jgi:hypothetical protein
MATPAQISANRLNAMKSTGPRTGDGKSASRLNALRHGVDAQLAVIPGEDPAELETLTRDYHAQFRPNSPEQLFLLDTLIQSDWLRRRYMRLEAQITSQALAEMEPCENPLGALYLSDGPAARALERVRRHYEVAQRAWLTAFKQLQSLHQQQAEDALVMALHAPIPMSAPAEIGFVPQTAHDRREAPRQSPAPSPQPPVPISETQSAAPSQT